MITYLARWLIKDRENLSNPAVRQAYGMLCGAVGIGFNILLFIGKLFAGTVSGSIAITADAFNNLSDAGSSVITLLGFKMAGKKADIDHPFGHGRIEYLTGLVVSLAILLMGVELAKSSLDKIMHPEDVEFSVLTFGILVVSICVKAYMTFYNRAIGKKLASPAMHATAMDSLSDTMATTVVLIAMGVSYFTGWHVDGFGGLLVAAFILYTGICAAKDTVAPRLGLPPEPEYVKQIEDIVMSHDEVVGIHDLVVHDYGPGRQMISLHAEVPANADILVMHDAVDNIEHELRDKMGCTAVVHMDPIVTDDEETTRARLEVIQIVQEIDARISIHDFRMVSGPTHTNLIFDIVVPYDFRMPDTEVKERICEKVRQLDGNYYAVIDVDKTSCM